MSEALWKALATDQKGDVERLSQNDNGHVGRLAGWLNRAWRLVRDGGLNVRVAE